MRKSAILSLDLFRRFIQFDISLTFISGYQWISGEGERFELAYNQSKVFKRER